MAMIGSMRGRLWVGGSLGVALLLSGCGTDSTAGADSQASGTESSGVAQPSPTEASDSDEVAPRLEKRVRVAGVRELSATCYGTGTPTVIFLHGLIQPTDSASWAHAPELWERVGSKTRYCEYERANVGSSSPRKGPIPVTEAVADLHAVINGLGLETPVVLLGGSFGGLVAYTYAGTHPDAVAGVVLLDPTLQDELRLERDFIEKDQRLTKDAWRSNAEQIDTYGAYAIAQAELDGIPRVPGTIFVTRELWAPEGKNAAPFKKAVRDQQAALIARFEPHKTVTVDAPHAMMSYVPDEIAQAVLEIVDRAKD